MPDYYEKDPSIITFISLHQRLVVGDESDPCAYISRWFIRGTLTALMSVCMHTFLINSIFMFFFVFFCTDDVLYIAVFQLQYEMYSWHFDCFGRWLDFLSKPNEQLTKSENAVFFLSWIGSTITGQICLL